MKLLIDALGASAGGGLTYLWNVLPQFAQHPEIELSILADRSAGLSAFENVTILDAPAVSGTLQRFRWEQRQIPKLIRERKCDVLLCTGNFAIWRSPVPQILLSRNSLYTSADFRRDLWERGEYRMLLETRVKGMLARQSVRRAELTIAPSEAFARDLERWAGCKVTALHHGFDSRSFFDDRKELAPAVKQKLQAPEGTASLLFVSHYNYYRNFETLLRAMPVLKQRLPSRNLRLVLTCELSDGANSGSYRTEKVRTLLRELRLGDDVVELGGIPYPQLHHVYRACDVYVTPAYTETFAHPLVEAMASGLPIAASDIPVHREITGGAGVFFDKFSPADLADKVAELLNSPAKFAELREKGLSRAAAFSWKRHVARLIEMAESLVGAGDK